MNTTLIDIHNHLLPEVDDGAESWEESISMAQIAEKDGISTIVLTPHYGRASNYRNISEVRDKFETLKETLKRNNINIELKLGFEVFLSIETIQLIKQEGQILTIDSTRFIFVEFPFDFLYPNSKLLINWVLDSGLIPIIAHPERNSYFTSKPQLLFEMIEIGALSQVNIGSLQGVFGEKAKKYALFFLKNMWAQLIATDAHNTKSRPPVLSSAFKLLSREMSEFEIQLFVSKNPASILENKMPEFYPEKPKRRNILI